ncbi:hypothetical protein WDU94_010899 [Cyamophila willieti]
MGVLKWSKTDLEELDRIIRVQMTRYRSRHPKSAVERVYIPRKKGGLGLINLYDMSIRQIKSCARTSEKKTHESCLHEAICATDENLTPLNLKNEVELIEVTVMDRKEAWKRKTLHGRYPATLEANTIDKKWSHNYLRTGLLFPETEGFIVAIQDQVVPTKNYLKYVVKDPGVQDDACRVCKKDRETIQHITGGCSALAATEYKQRHDAVGKIVHHAIASKHHLLPENAQPGHKYTPACILQNETCKMYWDRSLLTDRTTTANRPDLVFWDTRERKVVIVDFAVVNENNIESTENTKRQKYRDLAQHIKEQWQLQEVIILPMVLSTTGIVPCQLKEALRKLKINENVIGRMQKTVILNTCTIVRKVLGM